MPTLYLIDAYAQFFRHYHAIRTPMTSPVTKEPTNMTFGFVGLLLRLLGAGGEADAALWRRLGGRPDHLAVALDVSGDRGTFRSQLYPEYKANRTAPPEDLEPQVTRCISLLRAIGVPMIGVEGYEADDVIATLVTRERRDHPHVALRMVSKDKDLKQLLDPLPRDAPQDTVPAVALVDVHTGVRFDAAVLRAETGLEPSQVVDMLTLMGDSVDNVPGVKGIGDKTAAKLIGEFGTLDALLARTEALKGKQAENVKAAAAHLPLSRRLIELRRDVPLEFDLASSDCATFDVEKLLPILKELGFNRYQDDVRNLLARRAGRGDAGLAGGATSDARSESTAGADAALQTRRSESRPGSKGSSDASGSSAASASSARTAATAAVGKNRKSREPAGGFGGLFDPVAPESVVGADVRETSGAPDAAADHASIDASNAEVDGGVRSDEQSAEGWLVGDGTGAGISAGVTIDGDYRCVTTREQLDALVASVKAARAVAVDTETTSLVPHDAELCGISLSIEEGRGWYIPIRSPAPSDHLDEGTVLDALRPVLEDPSIAKFGHNVKYDMLVLRRAGVRLAMDCSTHDRGGTIDSASAAGRDDSSEGGSASVAIASAAAPDSSEVSCDTMVASYLIDSSRSSHSLDALGQVYLRAGKQSIAELIGAGKAQRSFATVPIAAATRYAGADADMTFRLARAMLPQVRAMGLMPLLARVEMPLVEVLAELEWNGILVDPEELDRQRGRLQARLEIITAELNDGARREIGREFDPDSPKQLSAALFNKPTDATPGLGIKPIKKTKTGYSTDAEVLEKLAEDQTLSTPIPRLILEYRQLSKLVSTYLVALKDAIHRGTKRVHSSFNQTVAATGRLASSDPNLQNIPIRTEIGREIRKAFVAAPGHVLVTADYSQIELRLLAHLSRDPALIDAFRKNADIHTEVAAQIHGVAPDKVTRDQRSGAKMVNFGIVYGITAYGLAKRLNIDDRKAAEIIAGYKRRFAGITTFLEECVDQARRFGYVETMLKRRRMIPDIESTNPSRKALAERTAINSVVQGSAADLIKLAMVDLHRVFRRSGGHAAPTPHAPEGVRMLLQIHDELVFECPEASAAAARDIIVDRMQRAMELTVPLIADAHIGRNWFEGK